MERGRRVSRRDLLQTVGGMTLGLATAGCSGLWDDSREPPVDTPTGADDQAPTITEYRANPRENGTALYVYMEGQDDRNLETARVIYGDRELTRQPNGRSITVDSHLEDTATTSPDHGRVVFVLTDGAGNVARKTVQPDHTAPELTLTAQPTENAGEITLAIEAEDDAGLADIAAILDGTTIHQTNVDGTSDADERTVASPDEARFQHTSATARAEDWNGNTTEQDVETYIRKYDVMDDTRLDVGAVWISHQGGAFKYDCRESYEGIEPIVGIYDERPIPTEIATKHIDQMAGHGLNRLVCDYSPEIRGVRGRVEELLDSPLINDVELEPLLGNLALLKSEDENWRETTFPEVLTYLRDTFLTRDNVATINGRPVVSTWNFIQFVWEGEPREKVMDDFGSFETFVGEMRRHLRLDDGTDPYLILGKGPVPLADHEYPWPLVTQFDGIQTWLPGIRQEDGTTAWSDVLRHTEAVFSDNRQFADDHDMEFTPTIFPGSDFRNTSCRESDGKYLPRSPRRFQEVFELAEEYATSDRLNIATWNDWAEGTQIEPGTFNGTRYGTDYVEIVEEFQQGDEG